MSEHQENLYQVNSGSELAIYSVYINLSASASNLVLSAWHSSTSIYIIFRAFLDYERHWSFWNSYWSFDLISNYPYSGIFLPLSLLKPTIELSSIQVFFRFINRIHQYTSLSQIYKSDHWLYRIFPELLLELSYTLLFFQSNKQIINHFNHSI